MKNKLILAMTGFIFLFSQCKKDSTNSSDLTTDIVGTYSNGYTNSSKVNMTIIKVDDNTVSIDIDAYGTGAGLYMSTKMNSKNSFTLNTRTFSDLRPGIGDCNIELTGTGVYSNKNITIEVKEKETMINSPYTVTNSTAVFTATKQ